jgi:hypothetical protein
LASKSRRSAGCIALYMIFSALAWADVFVTLLALITTYRLRRWDQPVTSPSKG